MLTAQDVVSAYKLILGREPETAAIVQNYVNHSSFDQLRGTLLGSGEFAERLARDPHVLPVPVAALATTEEVRNYRRLLEALIWLALPIWNRSVLLVGDELANLSGFFVDHQCKVTVSAAAETTRLLEKVMSSRHAANTAVLSHDLGQPIEDDVPGPFDLVYGELPTDSSDAMRTWLDNVAEACSGTLVLAGWTAPGRSDDVFLTPVARDPSRLRTIATSNWIFSRLRERFEHIYETAHLSADAPLIQDELAGGAETRATYIASRSEVISPALKPYDAESRPQRLSRVRTAAAIGS